MHSLQSYIGVERLGEDGENLYNCSGCGKKVQADMGSQLTELPPQLSVFLKRFTLDYVTFRQKKVNDECCFPMYLDASSVIGRFHRDGDPDTTESGAPLEDATLGDLADVAMEQREELPPLQDNPNSWADTLTESLDAPVPGNASCGGNTVLTDPLGDPLADTGYGGNDSTDKWGIVQV
ncbi:hypothetical protein KIPB_008042 [Kipferlia bialata]|uniref:Peptidase C19 ubiquitin carboxyl-terminal hydrolase domain-containing protein n=1 Tax=Kipferlia bialata TaxID=797122 RepID=A0A9K3CZE2_9EUKA|nr:hypothetical protein KIPB_008042 [Kipferlia bialata]|eukprot:g8042.t1